MECTYSDFRNQGVGAEVKHTPITSKEEEDQLWSVNEMGTDTPKKFLQTVFFYIHRKSVLPKRRHRATKLEGVLTPISQYQHQHECTSIMQRNQWKKCLTIWTVALCPYIVN